jgi:DNA helicase II / ATP-dependent DNA helicase PcrA
VPHPIVDQEIALLQEVLARLDAIQAPAPPSETALEHLRDSLNERVKLEDQAALLQQFDQRSALLRQLRTAERPADVDQSSPYFGHMQLRDNAGQRDILIGKTTRMLRDLPIVDWRNAPVSKIFYRYRQEEEYEEEINGRTMEGQLLIRRTLTIRDRQVQRVDAPEGNFQRELPPADGWKVLEREPMRLAGGQGSALRIHDSDSGGTRRLGTDLAGGRRRADKHLPDIAALIDPTQFDLVTRPSRGFVLVRGTAGSGKTTVALHRIAYLAFNDPAVDSDGTLFVVFSQALRDYVAHVLPALRVRRVQVRTYRDWTVELVRRTFPTLPKEVRDYTPSTVMRLKLHPAFRAVLATHVERTPGAGNSARVIDDWRTVLTDPTLIAEVMGRVAPTAFSAAAIAEACEWNRQRDEELLAWRRNEPGVSAALDEEDLPLLLRLWQLRVGPLLTKDGRPLAYRHVAIDEVQDLSPIEIEVLLGCLDDRHSVTLAGDTQQHVSEAGGFTSWADFLRELGLEGSEVDTLEVSYRCSHEIATFAIGLLGDLREDDTPPRTVRSGPPVELFRFTDHGACVAFLTDTLNQLAADEPLASVALLTPSRELSDVYFRGLHTSEISRFTFAPGVEVTEVEQVKGLEFDYVILIEASTQSYPDTPSARRRLHVGATRAVHQLWLTSVGTPSAIVREQIV